MWIIALAIGVWWIWFTNRPAGQPYYEAKDKTHRRVCY